MRIAYVLGTYPTPSETFIANEIEGLQARDYQVDIFSLFPPASGPAPGVHYGWASAAARLMRRLVGPSAATGLATRWGEVFRVKGYRAVLGHFGSLPSTVAMLAAEGLPFFLSLHARDIYVEGERLEEKMSRALATVTCTRANLRYLRDHYVGNAERMHAIYHGLPRRWTTASIPERPRAPHEPLRLLAVGRLVAKKGFSTLLEACARLHQRRVPFTLRILGEGPLRSALEAKRRRLGLNHQVALPGWMPQHQLRAAYAWADVFCCPSVEAPDGDRDGLPNVLLEAMCTGLPAVGSRLSGIPEAIEHDATGLLVPPGQSDWLADHLAHCVDPALRARLGANAADRVREHFDAEKSLDQLARILYAEF